MKSKTYLFPALFTPEECNFIVSLGTKELREGTVGHGGKQQVNEEIRKSKVNFLDVWKGEGRSVADRVRLAFVDANVNCFYQKLNKVPWLDFGLQFTEYDAKYKAKYNWHTDNHLVGVGDDRKLSIVVQLSAPEAYKGAKLEIEDTLIDEKRFGPQGSAIVFPSFLKHRVTEAEEGVRHSLVSWAMGPRLS